MPKTLSIRAQIYLILVPALLYVGLFFARPLWFRPWCAVEPTPCQAASVNELDQISLHHHSITADFISNLVQNGVGLLAFIFPWIYLRGQASRALRMNLTLLSAIAWNGVLIEVVRALVQRPRPLVFNSPLGDGANIHQYTSFYSGHTSFVALACLSTYLFTKSNTPDSSGLNRVLLGLYLTLSALTGVLRVFGGRHYPTDTLGGFFFGSLVAFALTSVVIQRSK